MTGLELISISKMRMRNEGKLQEHYERLLSTSTPKWAIKWIQGLEIEDIKELEVRR